MQAAISWFCSGNSVSLHCAMSELIASLSYIYIYTLIYIVGAKNKMPQTTGVTNLIRACFIILIPYLNIAV